MRQLVKKMAGAAETVVWCAVIYLFVLVACFVTGFLLVDWMTVHLFNWR